MHLWIGKLAKVPGIVLMYAILPATIGYIMYALQQSIRPRA